MLLSETSADTVSVAEKRRDLTFLSGVYFGLSRGSPDSKSTAATPSMNPVITAMVDAGVILLVNVGAIDTCTLTGGAWLANDAEVDVGIGGDSCQRDGNNGSISFTPSSDQVWLPMPQT